MNFNPLVKFRFNDQASTAEKMFAQVILIKLYIALKLTVHAQWPAGVELTSRKDSDQFSILKGNFNKLFLYTS